MPFIQWTVRDSLIFVTEVGLTYTCYKILIQLNNNTSILWNKQLSLDKYQFT